MSASMAPVREPGPSLRVAVALMVLGGALAVACLVPIGIPLIGDFTSPIHRTPGSIPLSLRATTYSIYERVGSQDSFGPLTTTSTYAGVLSPGAVTIRGDDGTLVPARMATEQPVETINRNGAIFLATIRFTPRRAGRYTVSISEPSQVIVGRSIGGVIGDHPRLLLGALAGGLAGIVGVVLAIVGEVRRGRARRPPGAGGWYPDPLAPGTLRYHDGRAWTAHRADRADPGPPDPEPPAAGPP